MYATYSPEDNKLRLYSTSRLDSETYARVKAAGFKWAPKQELFVAPGWTPAREDLLLELCGEIGDEDYSPEERSADRAERFAGYRDKRRAEAHGSADTFDAGPSVFGNQSQRRAERQAARHDRHRLYACSQWSKAEYWQSRTAGVIRHALYKSSAPVRRSRLLRLEAEQRKNAKEQEEYAKRWELWQKVPTLEGADKPGQAVSTDRFIGIASDSSPAFRLAYQLANDIHCYGDYTHPRTGEVRSLYSHLTDPQDPITPAEAAALWLDGRIDPSSEDSHRSRWARHYEMRLAYERAMLAAEGGMASDAEMIPGGWIGRHQIHKVNRSPATGRVVSVGIWGEHPYKTNKDGTPVMGIRTVNIERLDQSAYRAPTPEELEAFKQRTTARKAEEKAAKPKAPPLINPTDEDAQKLQDIWNAHAEQRNKRNGTSYKPAEVVRMTQAEYSARSKGSYARCMTAEVTERLRKHHISAMSKTPAGRTIVFKVRIAGSTTLYGAERVVIITDKPQKPIPWAEVEREQARQPSEASLTERLPELARALAASWLPEDGTTERRLIDDAVYVGWAYCSSLTQFGFTEKGAEAWKQYQATHQQEAEYAKAC